MTSRGKPFQHYAARRPRKDQPLPFACFVCRKSFKRPTQQGITQRPCPVCGGPAVQLGRYFQPPPQHKRREWQVVEYLVEHGYAFDQEATVNGRAVKLPRSVASAEEFLRRTRER